MEQTTPKSIDTDSGSVFFDQRTFSATEVTSMPSAVKSVAKRNISKSKLREYRDAFSLFDKDGNGYLTKEELGHVMHQVREHLE